MAASITLTPVPSTVTSGAPGSYTRGEELQLDWSVRNTAGTLTAPSDITFTVRAPDGTDTDYGPTTDNADGTGTLVLVLDQSARWLFRCVTDTPTTAATIDVMVERDAFEDSVLPVPASPGATFDGGIARVASGGYAPYLPTEEGETLTSTAVGSGFSWQKRRGWIIPDVDLTGVVDATAAINAALNTRDGACVYLPDGIIKLAGQIVLGREGNVLTSAERGFKQPTKIYNNGYVTSGCLLNVTHTGVAFLWDDANCGMHNFEVYYPNQDMTPASTALGSLTAYDYTFHVQANMHGASLTNITAHNAYKLLKFEANGGQVDTIKGFPLFRGVTFPRCGAAPDMQNVQFNGVGDYSQDATLEAWVKANGVAYLLDGIEGYSFRNCKALGYNVGLQFFDEDNDGFTGVYGEWYGLGLEGCNTCILVNQPGRTYQPLAIIGGKFTDCTLVPELSGYGIDFADTAVPANFANRPGMIFHGLTFHSGAAGASRAIWIRSGSYANVAWLGGNAHYQGGEHLCRMDSATGVFRATGVTTPAGSTRTSNGGAGYVSDKNGYVQEIGSGGTRIFDDYWDRDIYYADRTTALGSTAIFGENVPKGSYQVDVYLAITTTGTSGTIDTYITSSDDIGSNDQSFSVNVSATNRGRQRYVVETNGSTDIHLQTIHTSIVGSPHYSLRVSARRLSKN